MCISILNYDLRNPITFNWEWPGSVINTPFASRAGFHPHKQELLKQKEDMYDEMLDVKGLKLPMFFKATVKNKRTGNKVNLNFHPLNYVHIQNYAEHMGTGRYQNYDNAKTAFRDCFIELMRRSYNKGEHMAVMLNTSQEEGDERAVSTFNATVNNLRSNYSILITLDKGVDTKPGDPPTPLIGKGIGFLGGCDNFDYLSFFYQRPFQNYSQKFDPLYEVLRKLTYTHYSSTLKRGQAVYLFRGAVHENYQGFAFLEKVIFLINAAAKADGFTHSFGEATNVYSAAILENLGYDVIASVPYSLFTDNKGKGAEGEATARRPFAAIQDIETSGKGPFRPYIMGGVHTPTSACNLMVKAFSRIQRHDDPFLREIPPQEIQKGATGLTISDIWRRRDIGEEQPRTICRDECLFCSIRHMCKQKITHGCKGSKSVRKARRATRGGRSTSLPPWKP